MHPELKAVIELQRVDLRVEQLTAQMDALPSQVRTLEAQLNDFLHAQEDRKRRLAANQKVRRDQEGEIQVIQSKISRHKDQLYEVKTNEQYRAMLKEIEGEEANIRKIEDKVLEKMLEAEEVEKLLREAAAKLEGEKARVATEVTRLESLRQEDIVERDRLLAQRQEHAARLSAEVLEIYERVRKAWRGVAVAEARDGSCTGCNVRLRPQVYNQVRAGEMVLACETCSRILYAVEPAPAVDAGGANASGEPDRAAVPH